MNRITDWPWHRHTVRTPLRKRTGYAQAVPVRIEELTKEHLAARNTFPVHECRVCLQPVIDPNGWIDIERGVGRIWVCPRHMNDQTRIGVTPERILLWTNDGPTLLWPGNNPNFTYEAPRSAPR